MKSCTIGHFYNKENYTIPKWVCKIRKNSLTLWKFCFVSVAGIEIYCKCMPKTYSVHLQNSVYKRNIVTFFCDSILIGFYGRTRTQCCNWKYYQEYQKHVG